MFHISYTYYLSVFCSLVLFCVQVVLSYFRETSKKKIIHMENNYKIQTDDEQKVNCSLKKNFQQIPYSMTLSKELISEKSSYVDKQNQNLKMQTSCHSQLRQQQKIPLSPTDCARAVALVDSGLTLQEVKNITGFPRSSISRALGQALQEEWNNLDQEVIQGLITTTGSHQSPSNCQCCSTVSDVGRDEIVSVFVRTSQQLQDMVRGYELKVNQTTDHISCLQEHISLLHNQLAAKNRMIARMCDQYLTLAKQKQFSVGYLHYFATVRLFNC
ncbi:hypothetical protein J6590_046347 [Homalodisca vitripennis]|nr:hypothetical protein J6590_046347 [Homalodisca vitripennis]